MRLLMRMLALMAFGSHAAVAAGPVEIRDFDALRLGATIVGPVGPEVEASFVTAEGASIGDLNSRVQCPDGAQECKPPTMPAGTIYTYIHEVTPGVDRPNDPPFAHPETVEALDKAKRFRLGTRAEGITGAVGYSYRQAKSATGTEEAFDVSLDDEGRVVWQIRPGATWQNGQTVTFFWQTTQPPVGPRGGFALANDGKSGTGTGPAPRPLP